MNSGIAVIVMEPHATEIFMGPGQYSNAIAQDHILSALYLIN